MNKSHASSAKLRRCRQDRARQIARLALIKQLLTRDPDKYWPRAIHVQPVLGAIKRAKLLPDGEKIPHFWEASYEAMLREMSQVADDLEKGGA